MKLWTIQQLAAWESFQERGILRGDMRRVWDCHRNSYKWLMKTLGYSRTPMWAWHTRYGKRGRPDLRESGHFNPGTSGVRIDLDVPDELVTLSRFDLWGWCVLNNWHLSCDEEDPDDLTQEMKRESWMNIFDLGYGVPGEMWDPNPKEVTIQATMPELRLDWVLGHTHFKAR